MKKKIPKNPVNYPVKIIFYWDDRCDLSNESYVAKMIEDALKGWVIVDDSKRYVKSIHHEIHDKHCICVEVTRFDTN